ncbi:hypothetical protein, partial [Caldovatus aquaticus]|nr:hypothetical protein [Caldovatus aquaticus]
AQAPAETRPAPGGEAARPPRPQDRQGPRPPQRDPREHRGGKGGPQRAPRPERRGEPVPVPLVAAPKPESPFAILATLKLRKAQ